MRYALATGLLLVGTGNLAAVDLVWLPRYVAKFAKAVPSLPVVEPRPPAIVVAPIEVAPTEAAPPTDSAEATTAAIQTATPEFPHLRFASSTTNLSLAARRILKQLAETLAQDPSRHVVLSGHSDGVGAPDSNQALSLKRARRSGGWLERHGVDPARIEVLGFGSTHPLDSDGASHGRAHNRRVEIDLR
jgi:OOP family OmpA-OmpF porin